MQSCSAEATSSARAMVCAHHELLETWVFLVAQTEAPTEHDRGPAPGYFEGQALAATAGSWNDFQRSALLAS